MEEKIYFLSRNHENELESLRVKLETEKSELVTLSKEKNRLRDDVDDYENRLVDQKNLINGYLQKIQDLEMSRY